jgi:sodium-type flagellar protein MotY
MLEKPLKQTAMLRPILFFALTTSTSTALSREVDFEPPIAQALWEVTTTPVACILRQHVPYYGKTEFAWRAGEQLNFTVAPNHPPEAPHVARFKSMPPEWKHHRKPVLLGEVEIAPDMSTIYFDVDMAHRTLQELAAGMEPSFVYTDWHDGRDVVMLRISPVTFLPAYAKYNACIAGLLNYGFDDIANTIVNFDSDKSILNSASRAQLERIALYVQGDSRIQKVLIDGHTDDTNSGGYNQKLSNRRAKAVQDYLKAEGVPAKKIEIKGHSEWIPVASNLNEPGKAQNRRVEVVLIRD